MDSQPNQPVCPECGGRIYSSIVNFGDPLPQKELQQSVKHSKESDVFLVVGSSLAVSPAANMPLYAKKSGAKIIIVNKQRTNRENITDIRFFEGAGESLGAILEKVQKITS